MEDTIIKGDLLLVYNGRNVKQDQIICFQDPMDEKRVLIKRCVAMPGDTLEISDGEIFTNHICLEQKSTVKQYTRLVFKDPQRGLGLLDSLNDIQYYPLQTEKSFSAYLNNRQRSVLAMSSNVIEIRIDTDRPDTAWMTYPKDRLFNWTVDNFGPVVLPTEGMRMNLSKADFILYRNQITRETTDVASYNKDAFQSYIFKNNYYFMMGDNRHNSRDSRYYGFVPENFILGRAIMVLLSFDTRERGLSRIRYRRCFHRFE